MLTSIRLHTSHIVGAQGPDRVWAWLTGPEGALAAGLFCVGFAVASVKHGGPGHALGWMGLGRRGPGEPPALRLSSPGEALGRLSRPALEFAERLLGELDAAVTELPGGFQTPAAVAALVVFALGALVAGALGSGGAAVAAGKAALAGASALLIACLAAPAAPVAGSVGAALGILSEVGGLQGLSIHLQAFEAALTSAGRALTEAGPRVACMIKRLGYVYYSEEVGPLLDGLGRRLAGAGTRVGAVVTDLKAALRVGYVGDAHLGPRLGWRYGRRQSQFVASVKKFQSLRYRLGSIVPRGSPGSPGHPMGGWGEAQAKKDARLRAQLGLEPVRGQPGVRVLHGYAAEAATCLHNLSAETTKLGLNFQALHKLGHLGLLVDGDFLEGRPDLLSALRLHRFLAPLGGVSSDLLFIGEVVGPWGDELGRISDAHFRLGLG